MEFLELVLEKEMKLLLKINTGKPPNRVKGDLTSGGISETCLVAIKRCV